MRSHISLLIQNDSKLLLYQELLLNFIKWSRFDRSMRVAKGQLSKILMISQKYIISELQKCKSQLENFHIVSIVIK